MNDRGSRPPSIDPDRLQEVDEHVGLFEKSANTKQAPATPAQKPKPRIETQRDAIGVNTNTSNTGLDLEDPKVRAELARRLVIQRQRREQAALAQANPSESGIAGARNTPPQPTTGAPIENSRSDIQTDRGPLAPPSNPQHVLAPQQTGALNTAQTSVRSEREAVVDDGVGQPARSRHTDTADQPGQAIAARTAGEMQTQDESDSKGGFGRFLLRSILLLVIPLAAILVGLWFYLHGGRYIVTENAYLKTNIIAVSADLPGRVIDVAANDNSKVSKGDLLFRIDDEKYRLEIAEAEADLDVIARDVESLRGVYRESLMENRQAQKRVEYLELEFARQQKLRDRQIGTGQEYDRARNDLEIAQSEGRVYREKLARALADLGGSDDSPVESHPRYARAVAAKAVAESLLKRTEIRAPASGTVTNMRLQPGEWVDDGKPVFSIIDDKELWIEANLKETQLTNIEEGQSVSFVVDAYPSYDFKATVSRIAPATGAEFALLPPQNATGNWVKVVQRVPLILEIIPEESAPVLRAGMTARVKIDSETERDLPTWLLAADKKWSFPQFVRDYFGFDRFSESTG